MDITATTKEVCELINELPRHATGVFIFPQGIPEPDDGSTDEDTLLNASDIAAVPIPPNQICVFDKADKKRNNGTLIDLNDMTHYEQGDEMLELFFSTGCIICFMVFPPEEGITI